MLNPQFIGRQRKEHKGTDRFGVIGSGCQRLRVAGAQRPLEDIQQGFTILAHLEDTDRSARLHRWARKHGEMKTEWREDQKGPWTLWFPSSPVSLSSPLQNKYILSKSAFLFLLLIAKLYMETHHWNRCITHRQQLLFSFCKKCNQW